MLITKKIGGQAAKNKQEIKQKELAQQNIYPKCNLKRATP